MSDSHFKTKVLIFGGTGRLGRRLVQAALSLGHQVTVYVRNVSNLEAQFGGNLPHELSVIEGDIMDKDAVGRAIDGHGFLVNSASHVVEGNSFYELCQVIIGQAQSHMDEPKRVWFLGGVAALEFLNTGIMGVDCMGVPPIYRTHKRNFQALSESGLDWSLMCPGPMVEAPRRESTQNLRVSVDTMPFDFPGWVTRLPSIALSLTMKKHIPELVVSYADVANLIMSNMEPGGAYSKKRVGVALPKEPKTVKIGGEPGSKV